MTLDVDALDAAGTWFRHIPHGKDPKIRPWPPGDNRWQHGEVVDALYLADSEQTLWAEWYRHLAERGVPPVQQLPRDVWRYRVAGVQVADLRDATRLGRVGLGLPSPGRGAWSPFQAVGEALWRDGWPGLVAPSAARSSGLILCLFVGDPSTPPPARPIRRPKVVKEPPVPPTGMHT